jgi:hypothetical protein
VARVHDCFVKVVDLAGGDASGWPFIGSETDRENLAGRLCEGGVKAGAHFRA